MAVCVYDNPATMAREAYQDGRLLCSITAHQMCQKGFNGHRNMSFVLNVGKDFNAGSCHGDMSALPESAGVR